MRHHFVRSLAGSRDPNFKNVTLLLHGDGTNGGQNNAFLDSSASNNTITRNGNVTQGSFSPYGDTWSNYFDGTGDSLTFASNAAFAIGTGQFTMEFWIRFNALSNIQEFIRTALSDINYSFIFYYTTSTNGLYVGPYAGVGGGGINVTWTPNINQWYHLAASRDSSNTQRLFIDGVLVGSSTSTVSYVQSGFGIFQRFANFNGYFSNFRFVNGTAIYTSNFTVPTAPLTAVPNTVLLTCQSNRFRDASSNNFTITRNGDVSVQRFSPFSPNAEYRTDRIGGSAYFDGNDWLQVANRGLKLTAGFFTAECWVYITTYPGAYGTLFNDTYWQGGHNGGYIVRINSTGQVVIEASNGNWNNWGGIFIVSSNSVIRGQWNHIAIVRGASDLINIYINGTSTTTPVAKKDLNLNSGSAQSAWESRIGLQINDVIYGPPGTFYYGFTGIISNLRVINGKCLYTANFTPPTEPLTAIPETTFLGRFANASIVDNAMMNNWETVGSTQISTSIKKYGTGSIYNPAGSSLRVNSIVPNAFGTGDFTVEFWLYPLGTQFGTPISNWTGPGNWAFLFEGQQITFSGPAAGYQVFVKDPTNITLNQWTHIAVSRASGTMRLFRNGIVVASAANSTSFTAAGQLSIGSLYGDGASWQFNGYFDDIRITSGIARYTSDFAPPTAPFPDF